MGALKNCSADRDETIAISPNEIANDKAVDAAIADFTRHRSQIEQAKGVLMAVYGISAEHAFDIMVWRSQETNTKLRKLVGQIIEDFTSQLNIPAGVRARADHLLLTAHERVSS
ncbi:hypothetical protein A5662_13680 [Mycobacteriaceae bacterium 1482268.1]|nr:hypothetical protein A5662_13680 [Mycobacteriaceae bacterium 1482268.1]